MRKVLRAVLLLAGHMPALAVRARHVADFLDVGFLALAGQLHHPELGNAEIWVRAQVEAEGLLGCLLSLGDVLAVFSIDEVDDDQPPGSRNRGCRAAISSSAASRLAEGRLLHIAAVEALPGCVDRDHRLRGADDEVAAALELGPLL